MINSSIETTAELQEELVPTPQLMEWIKEAHEAYENGELVAMNWDEAIAHLDKMIEESS